MLDFRHETFLALCKIGHYTKTAEALHISQPAVSQHIKFLEDYYGGKLFTYRDKTLSLTERGRKLWDFAVTMSADSNHLRNRLRSEAPDVFTLRFGATLSIGEFVLPDILSRLLLEYPNIHISMPVENTQVLLQKLRDGAIDFALVEGYFDQSEYDCAPFSTEEFIPVCGAAHPLAGKLVSFADLLGERLILRENGSGTRDVLEQLLRERNLSVGAFQNVCELGNMSVIKRLVTQNLGIAFLYRTAVQTELASHTLTELSIKGYQVHRAFHFVWLKNSLHQKEYLGWLSYFKGC